MCSFQTNYPLYHGFYAYFMGFQINLAGNLYFQQLILAVGHLFLKLFQLASQKWLPQSQIGWEYVPTGPIFMEPCSQFREGLTVEQWEKAGLLMASDDQVWVPQLKDTRRYGPLCRQAFYSCKGLSFSKQGFPALFVCRLKNKL